MALRAFFSAISILGIVLVGCSESRSRGGAGGPSVRIDSGVTSTDDAGGGTTGATHEYVMHVLNVGQADPAGSPDIVPGFNLDTRVSDDTDPEGCFHPDFTSPPPDNDTGVDNQMGPILASLGSSVDVEGSIAMSIADGSLILLVRVSGVNDEASDESITVELWQGATATGGPPMLDATGRLAAGQSFVATTMVGSWPGFISFGRARVATSDVPFVLPLDMGTLSILLRGGELRFDVAASGLSRGVVGGALDVDETVSAIVAVAPDSIPESLARSILEGQADLMPDVSGACQEVSMALTFDTVPAVIE
jgi:hypothetical protein